MSESDSSTLITDQPDQHAIVAEDLSTIPAVARGTVANDQGEPVLEVRHLYRFFGKLKAVNDVSFKAYAGQVMGFIGPNGAGKTTTMRIISTLEVPTAGDAFICGESVVDYPDRVRKVLGFMPDNFGKYTNMSVWEYIDFFARAYGLKGDARRDAVERVLVFTELRKISEKPITSLSKGMSQRLGLGRCLINDPQVMILDEPAAGLDPRARVELRELIHLLAKNLRKTIFISSHILTELGEICDSAVIIEAGKILKYGTIDDLNQHYDDAGQVQTGKLVLVKILGERDALERWLLEQPYVQNVQQGTDKIQFQFMGDEPARVDLLKKMIIQGFPITDFQLKTISLEDAFMKITKGIVQ
jgi:ABC-2 type transport system ATP-binding protein